MSAAGGLQELFKCQRPACKGCPCRGPGRCEGDIQGTQRTGQSGVSRLRPRGSCKGAPSTRSRLTHCRREAGSMCMSVRGPFVWLEALLPPSVESQPQKTPDYGQGAGAAGVLSVSSAGQLCSPSLPSASPPHTTCGAGPHCGAVRSSLSPLGRSARGAERGVATHGPGGGGDAWAAGSVPQLPWRGWRCRLRFLPWA